MLKTTHWLSDATRMKQEAVIISYQRHTSGHLYFVGHHPIRLPILLNGPYVVLPILYLIWVLNTSTATKVMYQTTIAVQVSA